jgi:hypothetical protein
MGTSPTTLGRRGFSAEFTGAVFAGLEEVIGDHETEAVLFHLGMVDTSLRPAEVQRKLVALFGEQATKCIEQAIVSNLTRRLNLPLPSFNVSEHFDFVTTVQEAERVFSSSADAPRRSNEATQTA